MKFSWKKGLAEPRLHRSALLIFSSALCELSLVFHIYLQMKNALIVGVLEAQNDSVKVPYAAD